MKYLALIKSINEGINIMNGKNINPEIKQWDYEDSSEEYWKTVTTEELKEMDEMFLGKSYNKISFQELSEKYKDLVKQPYMTPLLFHSMIHLDIIKLNKRDKKLYKNLLKYLNYVIEGYLDECMKGHLIDPNYSKNGSNILNGKQVIKITKILDCSNEKLELINTILDKKQTI